MKDVTNFTTALELFNEDLNECEKLMKRTGWYMGNRNRKHWSSWDAQDIIDDIECEMRHMVDHVNDGMLEFCIDEKAKTIKDPDDRWHFVEGALFMGTFPGFEEMCATAKEEVKKSKAYVKLKNARDAWKNSKYVCHDFLSPFYKVDWSNPENRSAFASFVEEWCNEKEDESMFSCDNIYKMCKMAKSCFNYEDFVLGYDWDAVWAFCLFDECYCDFGLCGDMEFRIKHASEMGGYTAATLIKNSCGFAYAVKEYPNEMLEFFKTEDFALFAETLNEDFFNVDNYEIPTTKLRNKYKTVFRRLKNEVM